MTCECLTVYQKFLSTLSLRRATNNVLPAYAACGISIHALLAESDWDRSGKRSNPGYFYPRSPCGERLAAQGLVNGGDVISIHALLAESDLRPR